MDRAEAEALGKQVLEAIKGFVARSLAPRDTRLSAVETRVGALSMIAGRGANGEKIAELESLIRRVNALEGLEARIKALEDRPALKYLGVWKEGAYREGDFVTDHGSLWHCHSATHMRPGTSNAWQLAVKRGKDAR